jgi:adenylate cyclase
LPTTLLAQSARHIGNIGFIPDADGALRRLPLLSRYGQHTYPALSLALVNCCGGGLRLPPAATPPPRAWPTGATGPPTPWSAPPTSSAGIAPDGASGRLVLVGSSSLTPGRPRHHAAGANRPGLGVQAAMLSTLLDRRDGSARRPGRAAGWPACTALVALVAGYALPRLSAARNVLLPAPRSSGWAGLADHAPRRLYSPTAPLASLLFLLTVAVPYQWQQAQHRSRHLLDTLRQYVAPAVVTELLQRPQGSAGAAPARRHHLIADMEGYTTRSNLPVEGAR